MGWEKVLEHKSGNISETC